MTPQGLLYTDEPLLISFGYIGNATIDTVEEEPRENSYHGGLSLPAVWHCALSRAHIHVSALLAS